MSRATHALQQIKPIGTMYKYLVILLFTIVGSKAYNYGYDCGYCQPEQIHMAYGDTTTDIVLTWSTFNDTGSAWVEYGTSTLNRRAKGTINVFTDGGKEHRVQYIHVVRIENLKPDTKYYYHVGSEFGWSDLYHFRVPPVKPFMLRAALFGDMGSKNAHSLSYLQSEAEAGFYDVIIHVGDFAYDMDTDDARVGDQFMRQIQPLAVNVPYMTCPGNHEQAYNFSNYKARFVMPRGEDMFYSWDLGHVHFISINTEYYYFLNYGFQMVGNQYRWLEKDLIQANLPKNRKLRPWIVLYGHRPMYCSNADDAADCAAEYTRVGLPLLGLYGLEGLLMKYGVDLVVWAHEHSYERTWPLYDGRVYNGSVLYPYLNPRAPVHIVTGSAGCQERTDNFVPKPPAWSAYRSSDYGYARLVVYNRSHLYLEQVQAPVHLVTGSAGCQEGRDTFRGDPFPWSAFRAQDYGYTRMKVFNETHMHLEQVSVELQGQVIDAAWFVRTRGRPAWITTYNHTST